MHLLSMFFLVGCDTGPDYGAFGSAIRTQKKVLEKDPCSEQATLELNGLLEKAGHLGEASDTLRAYTAACTPTSQFEALQLDYAMRVEDWPMALAILDRRVEAEPSSPRQRTQRAQIRTGMGDLAGAVADLRQRALVEPRKALPDALKDLAKAQEKAEKPCDAWLTWKTLSHTSRELKGEAQVGMGKILREPTCRHLPVTTTSKVTRSDKEGWFVFPVALDGKETWMGADTSSVVSVLSRQEAERIGIPTDGEPWYLRSFQGIVAGPIVHVTALKIGEVVVPEVDVAIVDHVPDDVPGMLGGDLLSRIELREESGKRWTVGPND